MDKIIEPVSYKKMVESFTEPAHTYGKLKEGVGAGYDFTLFGLKLQNVKLSDVEDKSYEGWGHWATGKFEAEIVPGAYDWEAEHPYWYLSSKDKASYTIVDQVDVKGGKVYGHFETSAENIEDRLTYETHDLHDMIGGGWSHTNLPSTLELEKEERKDYYKPIEVSLESNDGFITKATIELDSDYINRCIEYAIYGGDDESGYECDEEDWDDEEVKYRITGIDWDVDDEDDLADLPEEAVVVLEDGGDEDDAIDQLSDDYGFLVNGVESIERVYESKKSRNPRLKYESKKIKESSDKYAIVVNTGYYEGGDYWTGEDFTDEFLDALLLTKEDAEKEFEKAKACAEAKYGKKYPVEIVAESTDYFVESKRHPDPDKWRIGDWVSYKGKKYITDMFLGGDMVRLVTHDDEITVPCSEVYKVSRKEVYKESKSEDIKYLKYLLRKEEVANLDDEERWELQDLINTYGYPEEYDEACIPTSNDPDILDFVSTFKDTLGGSQKKREAALEELESIGDSLVETYPELEGKTPSEIARWCRSVLDGTWRPLKESCEDCDYIDPEDYNKEGTYEEYLRYCDATGGDPYSEEEWRKVTGIYESKESSESKLEEDAMTSKVRQGVLEINAARNKVDADVEKLDRTVNKVTNDMVSAVLNHKPLQEAAGRHVEVDFPIHISEDGLISESDARKLLRKLAADHKLRVGSHYDVYDSEANLTTWDFNSSKDPGFGYTFECNIVGNGIAYNAFYLNKKRNKVNLKDAVWVSDTTMGKMTESSRYTHRIVLKTNDPDAPLRYRMTHADTMRYRSEEEAKQALDDYNNRIGARLDGKGLHLEIEEIPQKPRRVASQVEGYENPFEVGDILFGDTGYSMVLPTWYEIVRVTPKQVTAKELCDITVSHDGYGQAGVKKPNLGVYQKEWNGSDRKATAMVKKHSHSNSSNPKENYYVTIDGHVFDIWDGENKSFDTYD